MFIVTYSVVCNVIFFFFSSRRRHTRLQGDWSSDVCSSDLNADNLTDYLGVRKYSYGRAEHNNQVGQVVGLAWTEVGGDLLTIEAAIMPGKGVISRTGSLGDVKIGRAHV